MTGDHKPQKRRQWLMYIGAAVVLAAGLTFVFNFFPEEEKELRRGIRNTVERTFPRQAARVAESFGLTRYGEQSSAPLQMDLERPCVVLIHGLDDPGKVWMNLAPTLSDENIDVWEMGYPNDQSIRDSAWLFHDELKRLRTLGIARINVVAHSMGGLVSRELLTNPEIAASEKAQAGELPRVTGLIMVGTPNHGSELARFRLVGEIRDQWVNLTAGGGHLLRGILDGAGEAKIDLLPGSQFLETLNQRPHPEGVTMLIIAGVITPWEQGDIERFLSSARERSAAKGQAILGELEVFLKSMSNGLGDGLVTVESTRLFGIEHRTVRGTHLSMIRNVSKDSNRIPPAIPLIVQFLEQM
jgi:pimeloyl-ACP methyl ester carboxylesterase